MATSTLLTAERTMAYTLQNSNFRFHWSQRAYPGSERNNHKREIKKRYNNSSMVTACLGHYRTSEHSRTYTGYFYFNCHYLNYNLSRKPNTARLKQWSGSSKQPFFQRHRVKEFYIITPFQSKSLFEEGGTSSKTYRSSISEHYIPHKNILASLNGDSEQKNYSSIA